MHKKKKKQTEKKEDPGQSPRASHLNEKDKIHVTNLLKLMARAKFENITMEEIAAAMATYSKVQELIKRPTQMKVVKSG